MRKKPISFLFLGALLSAFVVTNIHAQNRPEHFEESFSIEGICSFPVLVELSGKMKAMELTGGRTIIIAPDEFVVLTNLDDPSKQEVMAITGAFHETVFANGDTELVVTGRNLLVGLDPDALFVVTMGDFSFVLDENFNVVQPLTGKGRVIDICALLE